MIRAFDRTVSILRRDTAFARSSGIATGLLGTMLFAAIFLPRFTLHFGHRELSIAAIVTLVCVAALVVVGGIKPDPVRVGLYCLAIGAMLVAATFNGASITGRVSAPSFLLLAAMYFAYLFVVPDGSGATFETTIRLFRRFSMFVAVAGIIQFVAQVAIPGPTLFTFEGLLPQAILTHNFNFVIPVPGMIHVPHAGTLNKSNGFFLLEPSHFSQLLALAIIAEMAFFRPSWRLAVLSLALLLSYSGTGLALCALFVPMLLIRRGRGQLAIVILGGAFILFMFANLIHLTSLLQRVGEFDSEQSSAFARFLSPFYLFSDVVFPHVQTTLFGLGPGSIEPYFNAMDYAVHDPTWGKLFFEYGLVGTVPFLIFISRCLFSGARSVSLSAAVFVTYLGLGGNLVDARMEPLMLALIAYQSRTRPAVAASADQFRPLESRRPLDRPASAYPDANPSGIVDPA
jgi:hypothetical protein